MVTTITSNGKDYPVKFGMNALSKFCKLSGMKLTELNNIGENMDLENVIQLVYSGLKDGARVEKKKFSLEVEDVADMIDLDAELITKVMEVFSESQAVVDPKKKESLEEENPVQ